MIKILDSVTIRKPVAEVFAYAANQCNLPEWRKWITCVDGPDGQLIKGALYVNTPKILGREVMTDVVVEDVVPNVSYGLQSINGPLQLHLHMYFDPEGTGTKVRTHLQAKVGGLYRLFQGLIDDRLQEQIRSDGDALRSVMERGM